MKRYQFMAVVAGLGLLMGLSLMETTFLAVGAAVSFAGMGLLAYSLFRLEVLDFAIDDGAGAAQPVHSQVVVSPACAQVAVATSRCGIRPVGRGSLPKSA